MKTTLVLFFVLLISGCHSNKVLITGSRDYDDHKQNEYLDADENYGVIYFLNDKDSDSSNFSDKYIFSQYGEIAVYAPEKYSAYKAKPGMLMIFVDGLEGKKSADKEKGEKLSVVNSLSFNVEAGKTYFVALKLDKSLLSSDRIVSLSLIKVDDIQAKLDYIDEKLSYITVPEKKLKNTAEVETKFLEESKNLSQEEVVKLRLKYLDKSYSKMTTDSSRREAKGTGLNLLLNTL